MSVRFSPEERTALLAEFANLPDSAEARKKWAQSHKLPYGWGQRESNKAAAKPTARVWQPLAAGTAKRKVKRRKVARAVSQNGHPKHTLADGIVYLRSRIAAMQETLRDLEALDNA